MVRREQQPFYSAVWATAPRKLERGEQCFLSDGLSDPLRRAAMLHVIETSQVSMTDLTDFTFADPPGVTNPSAVIYAPAWTERNGTYNVIPGSSLLGNSSLAPLPADNSTVDANISYGRAIGVQAPSTCSRISLAICAIRRASSFHRLHRGCAALTHWPNLHLLSLWPHGAQYRARQSP